MKTFISLLRGINVGGHNQIKMDALREVYVSLGYSNVKSFIQSGNLIFCSEITDSHLIEKSISERILQSFGFKVPVLVLTIEELKSALDNNPFIKDTSKNPTFMHLTFLSETPDSTLVDNISTNYFSPDEFDCFDKAIYLYCPAGYGNTKLNNTFFEKKLKVTATTRNLKTSLELLILAKEI